MSEKDSVRPPDLSERSEAYFATLETCRGQRHLIVLHDFPDPDAISSAYAHRMIAAAFDIEVEIIHGGRVSHAENIALVRLLGIEMRTWDSKFDLESWEAAVLLDHQGTQSAAVDAILEHGLPILMVIDHHEAQPGPEAQFRDLRKVGAVATIFADYLDAGVVSLEASKPEHVKIATALMHGIMSDTRDYTRAGPTDFEAASRLSRIYDSGMLAQIVSQSRPKQTMEVIRRALGSRVVVDGFSIAGVEQVRAEDRDAIPQAADFLLSEENVHTAIVYGIVGGKKDEILIGSMRTAKLTIDPDAFIKETFGKDPSGQPFGGGKISAGGFAIPIGFLAGSGDEDYQDMKWRVFDSQLRRRILDKIGYEEEKETPAHVP
jgi:nanoRNase/pAp phosphatase (c-di-AMP/oligoRNAs hydrolase)